MKKKIRKYSIHSISFLIGMLGIFNVWAESPKENKNQDDFSNSDQMLVSIQLEKKQVDSIIDKMILSGRISSDEGKEAKRFLANRQESDLEIIKSKLIAKVNAKATLDH